MSTARELMLLFQGHAGAHGTHGAPERDVDGMKMNIKRTARTLREAPTLEMWELHVKGERPLGIIPIREDGTCSWGSIDVDDYAVNGAEVAQYLHQRRIPLVPCRSKSGGLHLFLFCESPQPAGAVQAALREAAAALGFAGCEIFPKQAQLLADRGDLGNWMVMPYFGSTYGGVIREQVGLKPTGAGMTISEFVAAARERLAHLGDLAFVTRPVNARMEDGPRPFQDGPPCLQHLAGGKIAAGGRNNALLMMGIYWKKADHAAWRQRVEECNARHLSPPLSAEEVVGTIRSLERKEYEYTCKTEPMRSHCNAAVCRTRKHGVGEPGSMPVIGGISKLDCDPPVWFIDVGDARLEVTTEQLQSYQLMHRVMMDRCNTCYGTMTQKDWLVVLGEAMQGLNVTQAPPEIGAAGTMRESLEEFLTNRQRGETREDLLSGRPYEDQEEGRYYFRIRDFMKFLERDGVRGVARAKVAGELEKMGGGQRFFNVKNKNGVSAWWVPSATVQRMPEAEAPRAPREEQV